MGQCLLICKWAMFWLWLSLTPRLYYISTNHTALKSPFRARNFLFSIKGDGFTKRMQCLRCWGGLYFRYVFWRARGCQLLLFSISNNIWFNKILTQGKFESSLENFEKVAYLHLYIVFVKGMMKWLLS